jgi:hypothetical protein
MGTPDETVLRNSMVPGGILTKGLFLTGILET